MSAGEQVMSAAVMTKLTELENIQAGMRAELKVVSRAIERMAQTSEQIVELRAECLHMMKAHERAEQAHDELFERLRGLESAKIGTETKVKSICQNVDGLQRNQRWVALTVIGALIVGFIGLGFGMAKYELLSSQHSMAETKRLHNR